MHRQDMMRTKRLLEHVELLRRQLDLQVAAMESAPVVTLAEVALLEEMEDELRLRREEAQVALDESGFGAYPALPAAAQ